jgi:hypothetical protein
MADTPAGWVLGGWHVDTPATCVLGDRCSGRDGLDQGDLAIVCWMTCVAALAVPAQPLSREQWVPPSTPLPQQPLTGWQQPGKYGLLPVCNPAAASWSGDRENNAFKYVFAAVQPTQEVCVSWVS